MSAALWDRVADKVRREQAQSRLTQNRQAMSQLNRDLQAALREAAAYRDPDLSPAGLDKRRAEMADRARRTAAARLEELKAQVQADLSTVREFAAKARPRIADDPAAIMRHQIKWDQVRMKLEAGMPLSRILATADQETALAVQEWAPSWLEAQAYSQQPAGLAGLAYEAPDPSGLMRAVDDRLAELAGGDDRAALAALRQAEAAAAGFEPLAAHVGALAEGWPMEPTAGLEAAISAELASQAVNAPLGEASSDPGADGEG